MLSEKIDFLLIIRDYAARNLGNVQKDGKREVYLGADGGKILEIFGVLFSHVTISPIDKCAPNQFGRTPMT